MFTNITQKITINPKETGVKVLNTNGERFRESKIGIFYHVEDGD